jgi:hypothetical protein
MSFADTSHGTVPRPAHTALREPSNPGDTRDSDESIAALGLDLSRCPHLAVHAKNTSHH